jgi:hypothetical protein
MRIFTLLYSMVLLSSLSFGQDWRGVSGYCPYGCGPYIPLLTTPSLSFSTVSQNPAGATNATGGLVAGATNSTLSEVTGDTDAVYTMPVWYSGGEAPLVSPGWREPPTPTTSTSRHERRDRYGLPGQLSKSELESEQERQNAATTPVAWIYFSSAEPGGAEPAMQSKRSYSNDDVSRQNQQNGVIKRRGTTQKIQ